MAKTKEVIDIYSTTATSVYTHGVVQKISINQDKQYYYKRNNTYNMLQETIQGVGIFSGVANKKDWDEYKDIKNKIFIGAKKSKNFNSRSKSIGVRYLNENEVLEAKIVIDNNKQSQDIQKWFKNKKKEFSDKNKFNLETGFTVEHVLKKINSDYELDLIIKNHSNDDLKISGIKKWDKNINSLKNEMGGKLVFSNDEISSQISLNEKYLIEKNFLENIEIKSKESEIVKFIILGKEVEDIVVGKNGFVTYVDLQLNVENQSLISGPFTYTTIFKILK